MIRTKTIRALKLVADAGEPDDVLARRIDVVAAAQNWYDAQTGDDYTKCDAADGRLENAVRRYRSAIKRRQREQGIRTGSR